MAFDWPPNVHTKTRTRIAQILWTLWLDFEGNITDSPDAVKELLDAMRGHGVPIGDSDVMGYRIILPHLDGGKYGHYVRRLIIGQRTKAIELVSDLPDESHLPDGAGGYTADEQIDRQLFGEPARGLARDGDMRSTPGSANGDTPARGDTRDEGFTPVEPARGPARDEGVPGGIEPARVVARDDQEGVAVEPARGIARDITSVAATTELAREPARDEGRHMLPDDELEDVHDVAAVIRRLDAETDELLKPVVAFDDATGTHRELLDTIVGLVAELEERLSVGVGRVEPEGRTEADWAELRSQNEAVTNRLSSIIRRAKSAEERLIERNGEVEGLKLQLRVLQTRFDRLEANNEALMRGEREKGQHVRGAQRFLSEVPSDRPEGGRNRRTTGSESRLAYSVGPP